MTDIMYPAWSHIIIHHSWTTDQKVVDWQGIRRYHVEEMKWDDIGYHFGIEKINDHYEILKGRSLLTLGAHCKEYQMNSRGIGICLIGNFDKEPPCKEQMDCLYSLCNELMRIFNIPKENVKGHREFANYKSCPGWKFDLDQFRRTI